jgi:mRNA interferase HigB
MRIISTKTIKQYWEHHPNTRAALESWHNHAKNAHWNSPDDLVRDYGPDVVLPDNRAVFNIKGNGYRLVVRINYHQQAIYIRFIGTHAEYDKIDAKKI